MILRGAVSPALDDGQFHAAKNAAFRLLTYRPRSSKELEQKLRDKEFPPEVVASVIHHCQRLGYLDDAIFAAQWASSRVRLRGFGRRRIEQELRRKGLEGGIIRDTLARIFADSTEFETANREAGKKLRSLARFEPEARKRRLAGFLERRGFSAEIIGAVLRTVR